MGFDVKRFKTPEKPSGSPPELRSPRGKEEIRVHPDWCFPGISMAKSGGKVFMIDQALHGILAGRMITCSLYAAITPDGTTFVWPVRDDDKVLKEAASKATSEWIVVAWDTNAKTHSFQPAETQHDEPKWAFKTFEDLLDAAVADRILTDPEHAVVKAILAKKKRGKR
jgi:hypothetical protein